MRHFGRKFPSHFIFRRPNCPAGSNQLAKTNETTQNSIHFFKKFRHFLPLEADESADFSVAPKDKTAAHLNSIHRNDLKFRWKNVLVAYFDRVKSQIFICSRWTFTNFFALW